MPTVQSGILDNGNTVMNKMGKIPALMYLIV